MAVAGVLLAIVAILCAVLYFFAKRKHNYWAEKGVPHEEPVPFFGNLLNVLTLKQSIYDLMEELYHKYPNEPVVGFYGFTKPMVLIRDLDIIKDVLIKNFSSFVNRSFHCDEKGDPLGYEVMFNKWDDEWRQIRLKTTSVFSSGKMREIYPMIDRVGEDLNELCAKTTEKGEKEVNVRNLTNRFTVDVITAWAFGSQGGAIGTPEKSIMFKVLNDLFQFTLKTAVASNLLFFQRPLYCFVSRLGLGIKVFRQDVEEDVYKIIDQATKERLQSGERRPDFFDQIVFSNAPEFQGLKKKAGASFQMLLAGTETSSTTIVFALYELARHPEAQKKLQSEIREALKNNNGQIPYNVLIKMEYLDQVINETVRLYPILPFLDRIASKDYHVPGTNITIEKGTKIFIPLRALQKNPNYFPDPESFKPERFSKETGHDYPDMAYIPFGAGPRYCIGKRFGILTVKNFLVNFLKNFDVHLSEYAKGPLDWNKKNFTLALQKGMPLIITPSKDKDTYQSNGTHKSSTQVNGTSHK